MKKAIKRLIALTMLSASLALTAFAGCGEAKPAIKQNLKYDVTDKTEAFFIDADQASAVSIDGKLLTADEYVVKNGYILLDEGIYASLGKGEHAIALTADGKTSTFKLTVTDDADLSYVLPEIADVVFVGSSLPKVSFFNDVQSREVSYSLKINGAECALTDDGQLNHINSLAAGDCEYSIKITRNGKEIENKVFEVEIEKENLKYFQENYRVSNLFHSGDKITVRTVTDTPPKNYKPKPVPPTLEDLYLYVFEIKHILY